MITTKEELLKDIDALVQWYDDDILFYMQEYKHIMSTEDIATYLVRAFKNRVWTLADEFLDEE